jgi:hypothetical protein
LSPLVMPGRRSGEYDRSRRVTAPTCCRDERWSDTCRLMRRRHVDGAASSQVFFVGRQRRAARAWGRKHVLSKMRNETAERGEILHEMRSTVAQSGRRSTPRRVGPRRNGAQQHSHRDGPRQRSCLFARGEQGSNSRDRQADYSHAGPDQAPGIAAPYSPAKIEWPPRRMSHGMSEMRHQE